MSVKSRTKRPSASKTKKKCPPFLQQTHTINKPTHAVGGEYLVSYEKKNCFVSRLLRQSKKLTSLSERRLSGGAMNTLSLQNQQATQVFGQGIRFSASVLSRGKSKIFWKKMELVISVGTAAVLSKSSLYWVLDRTAELSYISFNPPRKRTYSFSAHRLINVTLLTLVLSVVCSTMGGRRPTSSMKTHSQYSRDWSITHAVCKHELRSHLRYRLLVSIISFILYIYNLRRCSNSSPPPPLPPTQFTSTFSAPSPRPTTWTANPYSYAT